jgi:DNA modification methylase
MSFPIDLTPFPSQPSYLTNFGACFCGDSLELLAKLPDSSIDLVMTSPPFALQRKKEYGNEEQSNYLQWFKQFALLVFEKLKSTGSFVVDLGGAYKKGKPVRSLYNFRIPILLCDEIGFFLAEDFYWFNPSKLPSPIEWVNKRKIRAKDSVNTIWWFSKSEYPKADVRNVLVAYSERMKKLLSNPNKYYKPKKRPSGHEISASFAKDNGGAIPSNLLEIPNTESNSSYMKSCKLLGIKPHPARYPARLPEFFINFLTDPGDIVVDIFSGSNTTGESAEKNGRYWIAFEKSREYVSASSFRFVGHSSNSQDSLLYCHSKILSGESIKIEELGGLNGQIELFGPGQ